MRYLLLLLLVSCTPNNARTQSSQEKTQRRPEGGENRKQEESNDIKRYVKRLESKNASVCMDSVDYLPYFGNRAVPALIEELKSESANGRGLAAATLARIPDKRSVGPLIALLGDKGGVELNVLSDDGKTMHPAYDNPALNVDQQVRMALTSVTGKRFRAKKDWENWWKENEGGFNPGKVRRTGLRFRRNEHPIPDSARYLKGIRILIDPGHGGDLHKRGYKRGPTYMSEAELNLRVSRFLRDFLEEAGAVVFMTRDSDRELSLKDRAQMSTKVKADLFLSVHHNWSPRTTAQSTTTWYHRSIDHKPAAVDLARYIQDETIRQVNPESMPQSGGLLADTLIYKESGFGVLRNLPAAVPGCLVETTYYSNLAMERRLRDIEYNRREAYGMFLGFAKYMYYGVPRAKILSADEGMLRLKVYDGTEGRGAWKQAYRILSEFIVVRVDGKRTSHKYDAAKGVIEVPGPFAEGDHEVLVDLINIHKNHSWPRPLEFSIP